MNPTLFDSFGGKGSHPNPKKKMSHNELLETFLKRRDLWHSPDEPFVNAAKLFAVFQKEHGGIWSGLRSRASDLNKKGLIASRRGENGMQEYALIEYL